MTPKTLTLIAGLIALLTAYTPAAHAGWTNDPVNGMVPVCVAPGYQNNPNICQLGSGNTYIDWDSEPYRLYYQVLNSSGDPLQQINGRLLIEGTWYTASGMSGYNYVLPDGEGGCIRVFRDKRSGYWKIYGQRFDSQGNRLWGDAGLPLADYPDNSDMILKDVTCDSLGNFFLAWVGNYFSMPFQYVQKFNRDGERLWGDYGFCTVSGATDDYQQIVADGQGGVMDAWQAGNNLRFQHLDINGNPLLTVGGILLLFLYGNPFPGYTLCEGVQDGFGGAVYLTMNEYYMGMMDQYMICVDGRGTALWTYTSPVHNNVFHSLLFHPADSSIWLQRWGSAFGQSASYIHRFTPQGLSCFDKYQTTGAGFKMVPWRGGVITLIKNSIPPQPARLAASKVHRSGHVLWTSIVAVLQEAQGYTCVEDGNGGMVCVWEKWIPVGPANDIYAQRVNADGSLGCTPVVQAPDPLPPAAAPTFESFSSNMISYTLQKPGQIKLELFDLLGRRVMVVEEGLKEPGTHQVQLDKSQLSSGIYLLRLMTVESIQTVKVAVIR